MAYRQVMVGGRPALALSNDELECIVVPALGGKVVNLRRRRGREWLWRDPSRELDDRPADGTFPDTGGWDECFPNVAPGPMPQALPTEPPLPDHGELWSSAWQHDLLETPAATVLTARVEGAALPYEFQRDLILPHEGNALRIEYRLIHRGTVPFPFLWSAHPIFGAPAGMRLTLPSVTMVRVDHSEGRADLPADGEVPWPLDGESQSWAVPEVAGWSAKLYADIGASGLAILTAPGRGEQLEIQVDPAQVPNLGLYVDARSDGTRLGVEPCIGAPDRLDRAVGAWGAAAILGAGEHRHWSVTLRLPAFD